MPSRKSGGKFFKKRKFFSLKKIALMSIFVL